MIQYEENIFFAAEEAELDLCEEWRDWKNDAKSPKDLFPLRDFNKKPNCLFSRNVHLSFILSAPSLQKCQIHWKLKEERDLKVWNCRFYLFTKFIEVMIGLFYKIQSNQTLYLTLIRWSEQIQNFLSQPSVNFMLFESLISILDIFSRTLGLWSWSWSNTDPRNYRDFKIAIHDE